MKKVFLIIIIVIIIIILVFGGVFIYSKFFNWNVIVKKPSLLDLSSGAKVCSYLAKSKSEYACPVCSAIDAGEYWSVSTHCPGPSQFPFGQGYMLNVYKNNGKIELIGETN